MEVWILRHLGGEETAPWEFVFDTHFSEVGIIEKFHVQEIYH